MKISIITASYNYQDYIKEAIESVLAQTYSDWELIIVDDGSSDNSAQIIESYLPKDSRIKFLMHPNKQNKGLLETLKLGISQVKGDYVAFLESDDIWRENYLEEKLKIAQQYPNAGVIFNDVELFGDENRIKSYDEYFKLFHKQMNKKNFPSKLFKELLFLNFVPTFSCAMVKSEALKNCNFDIEKDFQCWVDWAFWLQLAYYNDFYYIPQKLTKWRIHDDSYMNKINKKCKNTNKMIFAFVYGVFSKEKISLKKMFCFWKYVLLALFFKLNRGLIKKFI